MSFSPQIELKVISRHLFAKIAGISLAAHLLFILVLFIHEQLGNQGSIIQLGKQSSAKVSMVGIPGTQVLATKNSYLNSSNVSTDAKRQSQSLQQNMIQDNHQEKTLPVETKERTQATAEKKVTKQNVDQELSTKNEKRDLVAIKKEVKPEKKNNSSPKEQKNNQKSDSDKEKQPTVPVFSELKKKYTTLPKRETVKKEKPENKSTIDENKKNNLKEKQISEDLKKDSSKNDSKEKQNKDLSKEHLAKQAHPSGEKGVVAANVSGASNKVVSGQSSVANAGNANYANGIAGHSAHTGEVIELSIEDETWSDSDVAREIAKHFRKPPGFELEEHITITFDIKDGKAINISPRRNEPLALYAAAKDSLIRSQFRIKRSIEHHTWLLN